MGIGIVLVFWAIVGGFLFAVYLALSHFGKQFPFAALLKKVMSVGVAAIGIPIALLIIISFALNFFPSHIFKSSFGFAPPPDVVDLKGAKSVFGDSGYARLRFRASRETVNRIIDSRFVEVSGEGFKHSGFLSLDSAPSYWRPLEGKSVRFFESDRFDDSFGSSNASLSYDESSGTVHFYWIGID